MKTTILVILLTISIVSIGCKNFENEEEQIVECLVENDGQEFNTLNGTIWRTDALICLRESHINYNLSAIDVANKFQWGNFVSFDDCVNFTSYNSAPCGNDCFIAVFGKYKFLSASEVQINRDSVTFWGECPAPTDTTKIELIFDILVDSTSVYLHLQE